MNKQELIKHFEEMEYVSISQMGKKSFIDLIEQLDEPQKVKVPQFVADWIEYAKNEEGYNVVGAVTEAPEGRIGDWLILDNVNTFARAWLDGYEVEKEKQYLVRIKGIMSGNDYLNFDSFKKEWYLADKVNHEVVTTHHTRKELEEANFGWVFDCPGVEIEEVEE